MIGKGHFEASQGSQALNLFKLGSIDDMEVGSLDEVLETDGEQVLALNLMLSTGAEAEIGLIPAQLSLARTLRLPCTRSTSLTYRGIRESATMPIYQPRERGDRLRREAERSRRQREHSPHSQEWCLPQDSSSRAW